MCLWVYLLGFRCKVVPCYKTASKGFVRHYPKWCPDAKQLQTEALPGRAIYCL